MSSEPTVTGRGGAAGDDGDHAGGLARDDLIAGRFRIDRLLGSGGMGDVYAAEDHELGGQVALKTIRPEIAGDPGMLERLRRETQLARQITHANVCRVFDLGRDDGGLAFLTMELLDGTTLAERLQRDGHLSAAEVAPLGTQIAQGLAAAHAAGVIHRDLKCANIMLVAGRPVIMDFGVARAVTVSKGSQPLTAPLGVAGTPAYMAPEQVAGAEVGPAADVYAFGVVLHEMLTGRRPFDAGAPVNPRWDALIRRCLDVDPRRRPSSDELARLIARRGPRRWAWWLAVAAACTITVLALLRWPSHVAAPASTPGPRRAVAVLPFTNLAASADTAWIATALSEMLTAELAASEALRTVPGETVARAVADVGPPPGDNGHGYDAAQLARLRTNLGADLVVDGRYQLVDGQLRVDVLIQDTAAGDTVAALSEEGPEDILDVVARGGRRLRLALGLDASAASGSPAAARPGSPEVTRLYAEGLARLRRFDGLGALAQLTAAVAAEPRFALAHSALAETYALLGDEARAAAEAAQASVLATGLGRADQLLVEARAAEAGGHGEEAVERYRALWAFYPDNLEYGLALAHAQAVANRPAEASATLDKLRAMPAPQGDDPRIDLSDADAARYVGDNQRRQAAAGRAARTASARGERLIIAQARIEEGWASFFLADMARAAAAFAEVQDIAAAIGARSLVAQALLGAGLVAFQEGHVADGKRDYEACLAIRREIGEVSGQAEALTQLGFVLEELGELDASAAALAEALDLGTRLAMPHSLGYAHLHLGWLAFARGDLPAAEREFEASQALFDKLGNAALAGHALQGRGEVRFVAGDLRGAEDFLERSRAALTPVSAVYAAYATHAVARVRAAQGRLAEARVLHEAAQAARHDGAQARLEPESLLELAGLAHDEGRATEAIAQARSAAQGLDAVSSPLKAALAWSLLAGLLAEAGDVAGAREAVGRAEAIAARLSKSRLDVLVGLAAAQVAAAECGAAPQLEQAITAATKAGYVEPAFRARLTLGRQQLRCGDAAAGQRTLAALARDARAGGWTWIAERVEGAPAR